MNSAPRTAVLLAAGRGERLRPHTDRVPKPLLRVGGRPTLDYVLRAAAQAGVRQAILVTHHLAGQIQHYVGDGANWGLRAVCCRQPVLDGTASALQAAVQAYPRLFYRDEAFLLTATDYALPLAYLSDLVAAHAAGRAQITISLKKIPENEQSGRSAVVFGQDGNILRVIEKPPPELQSGPLAASLTFVLPGSTLGYLEGMERSPRGEYEIQAVINRMLQDGFTATGLLQETPAEYQPGD